MDSASYRQPYTTNSEVTQMHKDEFNLKIKTKKLKRF